jgi:serine/threonine protein kinase
LEQTRGASRAPIKTGLASASEFPGALEASLPWDRQWKASVSIETGASVRGIRKLSSPGMSEFMNPDGAAADLDLARILPPEYRVEQKLGQGGSGQVYKAFNKNLQSFVAVKLLNSDNGLDKRVESQRLLQEARALSNLQHPNIVKIMSVGMCSGDIPFLVYEYLEGETLQDYICSAKELPSKVLSLLFEQLCSALDCIHKNNLVHRDIKPANIMILPSESHSISQVKLLDFGIAKEVDDSGVRDGKTVAGATATSLYRGSPTYMSPEQCQGKAVDFRSDIYSLACVLFECLTGKPPFSGESVYDVLYQHIHGQPEINDPKLCQGMRAVLNRALAKNPSDRFENVNQFNEQLQEALKEADCKSRLPVFNPVSVLALVALLAIPGYFALKQFNEKNSSKASVDHVLQTSRKRSQRLMKPHMVLKNIFKKSIAEAKNPMRLCTQIISEIDDLLPDLQTAEERYIANDLKAFKQWQLTQFPAAFNSYQNSYMAAASKRARDGRFPIEAAKELSMMALMKKLNYEPKECRKYAQEAVQIIERNGSEDKLKLPFDYYGTNASETLSLGYELWAEIDLDEGHRKEALVHARKAFEALEHPYDKNIAAEFPFLLLLKLLFDDGKKQEARRIVDGVLDEMQSQVEAKPKFLSYAGETEEVFAACTSTIRYLYSHGEYERILRAADILNDVVTRFDNVQDFYQKNPDLKKAIEKSKQMVKTAR